MTILETFIRLRDDIKLWVANNLNQKANISYVDEKIAEVPEFDPTDIQAAIAENAAGIQSNNAEIQEIKGDVETHNSEFAALTGNVDDIETRVGEVEVDLSEYKTDVSEQFTQVEAKIDNHIDNTDNPHVVTKAQVGLENVDNTSDKEKPISDATQEALNEKANISYVDEKLAAVAGFDPDEMQDAIDANTAAIDTKVDKVDGMGLSTNDYTTTEKDKLATIEDNANFYEHPTNTACTSGLYKVTIDDFGHVIDATLVDKEDIVALGIPAQDTTYETEISNLGDRIDDVEDGINTTNQTLGGISEAFESYKTTNNEAVAANASGIVANNEAIEEIKKDYLTSADKEQLQDDISKVSETATENAAAVGRVEGDIESYKTEVAGQFAELGDAINNHANGADNPHGVTKDQVGLDNVDNTSDAEKPISNATQDALDQKANAEHEHNANHITDGILDVAYGGTGYDSIVDTEYTTPRYRASTLVSAETIPSDNGVINWLYE